MGLGSREPLNHNEVFKQEDDALNVRARIIECTLQAGFRQHHQDDLRGRFRWMGSTPSAPRASTAPSPVTTTPTCSKRRTS